MMDGFGKTEAYGENGRTESLREIGRTEAYGEIGRTETCRESRDFNLAKAIGE